MAATREVIINSLAKLAPEELVAPFLAEFTALQNRYAASDYRPAELHGGRFSEAAFRICQHVVLNQYTPVGKTLPQVDKLLRELEAVASSDETFRIHIPRALKVIYDLRNKRDVAHLGAGKVVPNLSDAMLTMSVVSWAVSEFIRVAHQCGVEEAQRHVDAVVQRQHPLVWSDGTIIRVLDTSLSFESKVLLVLFRVHPEPVSFQDLLDAVEYSHATKFKLKLGLMHKAALIDFRGNRVRLLPPGATEALKLASDSSADV